jgi:hypothetical protein
MWLKKGIKVAGDFTKAQTVVSLYIEYSKRKKVDFFPPFLSF